MSETTPRLSMPFIMPSQAQKHVTHNEALVLLDGLVQMVLRGVEAETPPASGADGDAYGLGPAPTGLWEGRGGAVAIRSNGGWVFAAPAAGWRAWDAAGARALVHDGSGWTPDLPTLENLGGVGIGAASDAVNRLSVASEAVLLSHAGGDMRLTLNKAAASDTGSLLFQSGWSGRAEMGLAGSDAFEVKVSGDGASWATGLRIGADGRVGAPAGISLGGGSALEVYEEGTWSPVLTSETPATGTVQSGTGRYVRIGSLVHASFDLVLTDEGSGGIGGARVAGLPAPGRMPAASSVEHAGFFWSTPDQMLHVDGTDVVLGRAREGLDWSALNGGDKFKGAVTYIVS